MKPETAKSLLKIFVTNGFTKKTPKTPRQEIRLAQERRADYIRRMEGLE